ncbi:MAG: dockerin type I repeat-containing protein, partial [Clostridia bacterium]|nr:dockerin type I repeat-containing protein [Clostridia bacterium]
TRGRFCERCYAEETEEIPTTDHYWGSWNVWQEPTCTTAGIRGRTCQRCYQSEQEPIDTLAHEWQDGYCTRCGERNKISGISVKNGAQLTDDEKMIYGLTCGLNSAKDYFEITDNSLSLSNGKAVIGTGTHINVLKGEAIATYYEAVIFGDVNGDGWYDGMDAMIVSCLANGMLTQDDVSEAVYMAADCNHDGVIDQLDVDILNQAGVLLSQVDQSKSEEELLATSSAYIEYLNLIDQSIDAPAEAEKEPAQINWFQTILAFLNTLFKFIYDIFKF